MSLLPYKWTFKYHSLWYYEQGCSEHSNTDTLVQVYEYFYMTDCLSPIVRLNNIYIYFFKLRYRLPWWLRRQSICLQCGRPRFEPWVGKIHWRRKWQSTPVSLPGKSHGQRSLVGYSPWGRKESDTTKRIHSFIHSCFCCTMELISYMSTFLIYCQKVF